MEQIIEIITDLKDYMVSNRYFSGSKLNFAKF